MGHGRGGKYTKVQRHRLKSHDSGANRHNKIQAHDDKANRLAAQHTRTMSGMRRKKK